MEDDLHSEYNLRELRVRKVGKQRQSHTGKTIHLEPDVAEIFPDDNSVNEALRFLIRMTAQNKDLLSKTTLVENAER